jgi:integral membrane protein (TIGR01906 family)
MTSTEQRPSSPERTGAQRKRPSAIAVGVSQFAFLAEETWVRLRPWAGWRWVGRVGALLYVVALPVALVGTNVRVLFTAEPLYTFAVAEYNVPAVTGIPRAEIDRAMAEIREYFRNDQQLLRITVTDERGRTDPLFTPREVIHMRDVKHLVQNIFRLQTAALVYIATYGALRLLLERRGAWRGLARLTRIATLGTLAVAIGLGGATLFGFDRLFDRFHRLSFSNDFWQLDPTQDHLVQMFPFDFWLVSTVILVGVTIVEVLALLALSWWYLQRGPEPAQPEPAAADADAVTPT